MLTVDAFLTVQIGWAVLSRDQRKDKSLRRTTVSGFDERETRPRLDKLKRTKE